MAKKSAVVTRPEVDLPAVEVGDPLPEFASEREEAEFWATHSLGNSILDQEHEGDPDLPPVRPLSVRLIEVNSLDEVPEFASEREEADYWATHSFGQSFFDQKLEDDPDLPPPRPRPISVRFDADTITRLQAIAAKKHKGYQTLLKEFVAERLYEEEKREGIVGS